MSHRTNARPAPCARCRRSVAASAGTLLGPPWQVICQTCLPFPSSPTVGAGKIAIRHVGDKIEISPEGRLGGDRWASYKGTLDAAGVRPRKDAAGAWHHYATADQVAPVVAGLSAAGFLLDIAPGIGQEMVAAAEPAKAEIESAQARVQAVNAELAKRGKSLFPFQAEGVAWLAPRAGAILADDMGLGKTIQALTSLPEASPVLVICPAVAKGVWARETRAWRPDLTVTQLAGRGSFRWPRHGEMVVTNYDILPTAFAGSAPRGDGDAKAPRQVAPFLAECPANLTVIVDEAHNCKNRGKEDKRVQRTERTGAIADAARHHGGRVWELTATPLLNNPTELWSLLGLAGLQREAFPGGWFSFCKAMGGTQEPVYGKYGPIKNPKTGKPVLKWTWGGKIASSAVAALKRVMLRRVKDEVLKDLPALTYQRIDVQLPDELVEECDELWAKIEADFDDIFEGKKKDGVPFEQISRVRAAIAAAKIEAMDAIADEYEEAGEPLVVFSCHRGPIEHMAERKGVGAILGGIDPAKRTKIEEAFQSGELSSVACTVKAGGVAITLTRANHALFVDEDWTPALNDQARDRIRRIGTTKAVLVKILVGNHPLEERVADLLAAKRAIIAGTVEAARVRGDEQAANVATTLDRALAALDAQEELQRQAVEAELAHEAAVAKILADMDADERRTTAEDRFERTIQRAEARERARDGLAARRPAATDAERWAVEALQALAGADADRAFEQNDVGYNKADTGVGHALARSAHEGLTDRQWAFALTMLRKYHRQVGRAPEAVEKA